MSCDADGRDAVPIHISESLGHAQNRLVLSPQCVVLAQRSLGDERRLCEVAGIGDDNLCVRWRHESGNERQRLNHAVHQRLLTNLRHDRAGRRP